MSSIQATRMKRGMLIKMGNDLFRVLDLTHFTPGNKRGFVQARMRNIRTGQQADNKFRRHKGRVQPDANGKGPAERIRRMGMPDPTMRMIMAVMVMQMLMVVEAVIVLRGLWVHQFEFRRFSHGLQYRMSLTRPATSHQMMS